MTDLWHSLLKSEYSYLKIVAEKWGLKFTAPDAREGVDQLTEALLEKDFLPGMLENLGSQEREALIWMDDQGGKIPWDQAIRRFGQVREMGAGRLDRERPDLDPISSLEILWYRALIARGFFETENGPQEFAYLPEDLRDIILPLINPNRDKGGEREFICRKASSRERAEILPRPWFVLDQLCTLLAGVRLGLDPAIHMPGLSKPEEDFYHGLATAVGLLLKSGQPSPDRIRDILDLDDPTALKVLWDSWLGEDMLAELTILPEIELEGDPHLEAQRIRKQLLVYLDSLPPKEWWSIESFISLVKERHPDILRVGGEYESWFLKRKTTGEYLSGFEFWEDIEGELLRFLITGPLYWLGLIELGSPDEGSPPLAFKLTPLFVDFMAGRSPSLTEREPDQVHLRSQGEIRVGVAVPRKARYQIARFCDWYPIKAEAYHYRLSPGSLSRAENQGLQIKHLLSLLKHYAESIPPNLREALERWQKSGSQAIIEPRTILRLGSPAILKSLKKTRASRYIQEQLGPTVVVIHPGSEEKLAGVIMELGFFVQGIDQDASQT